MKTRKNKNKKGGIGLFLKKAFKRMKWRILILILFATCLYFTVIDRSNAFVSVLDYLNEIGAKYEGLANLMEFYGFLAIIVFVIEKMVVRIIEHFGGGKIKNSRIKEKNESLDQEQIEILILNRFRLKPSRFHKQKKTSP